MEKAVLKKLYFLILLWMPGVLCAQHGGESPDIRPFIRGDVNLNGQVNIADAVQLAGALFGPGTIPCPDSADSNDDGIVELTDILNTLNVLFMGASMPAPWPDCGLDPRRDNACYCEAGYCSYWQ